MTGAHGLERITRRRVKGWRKPPNTVIVDRTSRWGNPFRADAFGCPTDMVAGSPEATAWAHQKAVDAFRRMLEHQTRAYPSGAEIREHLHGKNLACPCGQGLPCHADVLMEIANA